MNKIISILVLTLLLGGCGNINDYRCVIDCRSCNSGEYCLNVNSTQTVANDLCKGTYIICAVKGDGVYK